jgi:hypothetical protein
LGRISASLSVLLRNVLKIIGTDELNLRQFIQDTLFETLEILLGDNIETKAFILVDLFDFKLGT